MSRGRTNQQRVHALNWGRQDQNAKTEKHHQKDKVNADDLVRTNPERLFAQISRFAVSLCVCFSVVRNRRLIMQTGGLSYLLIVHRRRLIMKTDKKTVLLQLPLTLPPYGHLLVLLP